jgi:hypothetical protein
MASFVDQMHQQIREFVEKHERFRPGTGSYSTPFRGTLFGQNKSDKIEEKLLKTRSADVLFLGANPNVPRSLDVIANNFKWDGDWCFFLAQCESGFFGEIDPDFPATHKLGWDPINGKKVRAHWKVFAEALKSALRQDKADAVAMQNLIPWGSRTVDEFLKKMESDIPDVLELATSLLEISVAALHPRLLLAPLSLCRHEALEGFPIAVNSAEQLSKVEFAGGGRFEIMTGRVEISNNELPIVFTSHPSYLVYQRNDVREAVKGALFKALVKALE